MTRVSGPSPFELNRRELLALLGAGIAELALPSRVYGFALQGPATASKMDDLLDRNPNPDIQAKLGSYLVNLQSEYDLPAVACACVMDRHLVAAVSIGSRIYGKNIPVKLSDQFELDAHAKAVTATLIGKLIEEGKLAWNTKLADIFPEFAAKMHESNRSITVRDLLLHTSGITNDSLPSEYEWGNLWVCLRFPFPDQRLAYACLKLAETPQGIRGADQRQINANYILAAAVAERIGKAPIDELFSTRIFGPLGIETGGFGPPGSPHPDRITQPRQHRIDGSKRIPVYDDAPPLFEGAALLHCSVVDFAKVMAVHLLGERGQDGLLKASTIKELHTPPSGKASGYACGWNVSEGPKGRRILTHGGCNGLSHSISHIDSERNLAVIVATNVLVAGSDPVGEGLQCILRDVLPQKWQAPKRETRPAVVTERVRSEVRQEGKINLVAPPKIQLISEAIDPAFQAGLQGFIESVRHKFDLAGMAVACVLDNKLIGAVAAGRRRFDQKALLTPNDQLSISSCGKPMAATVMARFVEQGKVRWTTTLGEIFPDLKLMREEFRPVTVEQLLCMSSGIEDDSNPSELDWNNAWVCLNLSAREQRELWVERKLRVPAGYRAGTEQRYKSANIMIAMAILERLADSSWEEIARKHLFTPLGMTTADFGPPGRRPDVFDQPRQHGRDGEGRKVAFYSDLGPAGGCICLSVKDFARFGALHSLGADVNTGYIRPGTIELLHHPPRTIPDGTYAFGWGLYDQEGNGRRRLGLMGTNGISGSGLSVSTGRKIVLALATNEALTSAVVQEKGDPIVLASDRIREEIKTRYGR